MNERFYWDSKRYDPNMIKKRGTKIEFIFVMP